MLAAKRGNAEEALQRIGNARNALGPELAAMVTENYDRSYGGMVRVQQLTELEEVVEYAELGRVAAAAYVAMALAFAALCSVERAPFALLADAAVSAGQPAPRRRHSKAE